MHLRTALRPLAATCAAVGLALPGAAYAESFTHQDATHDVQRFNFNTEKLKNAPHNGSADIVRTRLTYSKHNLISTVLVRSGSIDHDWAYAGQVHTGATHFAWIAEVTSGSRDISLSDANGDPVACDGITTDIAHHQGRIKLTIPASCIGSPDRVREGVAFAILKGDHFQFADDALQKRGLVENPAFALSPKLDRG